MITLVQVRVHRKSLFVHIIIRLFKLFYVFCSGCASHVLFARNYSPIIIAYYVAAIMRTG